MGSNSRSLRQEHRGPFAAFVVLVVLAGLLLSHGSRAQATFSDLEAGGPSVPSSTAATARSAPARVWGADDGPVPTPGAVPVGTERTGVSQQRWKVPAANAVRPTSDTSGASAPAVTPRDAAPAPGAGPTAWTATWPRRPVTPATRPAQARHPHRRHVRPATRPDRVRSAVPPPRTTGPSTPPPPAPAPAPAPAAPEPSPSAPPVVEAGEAIPWTPVTDLVTPPTVPTPAPVDPDPGDGSQGEVDPAPPPATSGAASPSSVVVAPDQTSGSAGSRDGLADAESTDQD